MHPADRARALMLISATGNVAVAQEQSSTTSPAAVTQLPTIATSHPWLAWAPLNNGYVEAEFQFSGVAGIYQYTSAEYEQPDDGSGS